MVNLKRTLLIILLTSPMAGFGQEMYESKSVGLSIMFPKKPFEKVGTHLTEVIYEDQESGLIYIISFKPTNAKKLKAEELKNLAREAVSNEKVNKIVSLELSELQGKKSIRIGMKADYDQYNLYYKLYFAVKDSHEVSIIIMSPQDNITFKMLDDFTKTLRFF